MRAAVHFNVLIKIKCPETFRSISLSDADSLRGLLSAWFWTVPTAYASELWGQPHRVLGGGEERQGCCVGGGVGGVNPTVLPSMARPFLLEAPQPSPANARTRLAWRGQGPC